MPAMSAADYRQTVEECDRLAETVTSPHIRETMLYMASRWRALAEEQEAKDRHDKPTRFRPPP